jgi:hypothetical protein
MLVVRLMIDGACYYHRQASELEPDAKIEVIVNGLTYDLVERKPHPRTLTLVLTLHELYGPEAHSPYHNPSLEEAKKSDELILARIKAFKSAFALKFPDVHLKDGGVSMHLVLSEWNYTLESPNELHFKWAKSAFDAGLIDNFHVMER